MIIQKYILVLLSLVFFTACTSSSQPQKPTEIKKGDYTYFKRYMDWFIRKQMEEQNIVGLSVALVDDQTIIWQKGFGYEDKEKKIKATKDTIYRAGSITKTINAMAVMKLAEEKRMDIDKPLKTYLPEFSIKSRFGSTDKITPRNIMTHHSGIPGDWLDKFYSEKPIPYTDYLELIKNEYVAYPPNKISSYSNLAITLLGHAVERTTDTLYDEFIQESFFRPMNMKKSYIKPALEGKGTSKSYANGEEVKDEYPVSKLPSSALNTTVSDLSNLAIMINNNGKFKDKTILHQNTLSKMFQVQNKTVELDLGMKIGLGFYIYDKSFDGLDRIYYHYGDTVNHHASFVTTEKSKLSVIVMTNTKNAYINPIAKEILKQARSTKTGEEGLRSKVSKHIVSKNLDIEGTYATNIGKINIIKKDNGLFTTEVMGNLIRLKKENDNKYYAKYMLFGLIPINDDMLNNLSVYTQKIDEKIFLMYEKDGEKYLFGAKVKPKTISKTWKNRLGTYFIVNQLEEKSMQVEKVIAKIEDSFLILEVSMKSGESLKYILEIVNDNEAIIDGIGRSMRETIRVKNDIFHYMGLQFKRKN